MSHVNNKLLFLVICICIFGPFVLNFLYSIVLCILDIIMDRSIDVKESGFHWRVSTKLVFIFLPTYLPIRRHLVFGMSGSRFFL